MKAQLKNLKKRLGLGNRKRQIAARDELLRLTPFIQQLLANEALRHNNNPAQLSELAYALFQRQRQDIVTIKQASTDPTMNRRFQFFVREVAAGYSPLSADAGLDVLRASNHFLGLPQVVNDAGMDIGTHFRISSSFAKKGRMLYDAVRIFRPDAMLEVGTAYGMSARFILAAAEHYAPAATLDTIESAEPQYSLSKACLEKRFGCRVRCHKGQSSTALPAIVNARDSIDFVFHDGAHDGEVYREDFLNLSPALRPGALIVFDDIRWHDSRITSRDPKCYEGWRAVVDSPEVCCAAEIGTSVGAALIGS